MLPVDKLELSTWETFKNPTMRMAIIRANIALHAECRQAEDAVLDNWTNNQHSFAQINDLRRSADTAVGNIALAAQYLGDQNPASYNQYEKSGIYSDMTAFMKKIAMDEYSSVPARMKAFGYIFAHGLKRAELMDTAPMEDSVTLLQTIMATGASTLRDGKPLLDNKINWDDPLNDIPASNAKIRTVLLETTIPFLSDRYPGIALTLYGIAAAAAQRDVHPDVRKTALQCLSIITEGGEDGPKRMIEGEFAANIADICATSQANDPSPDVRKKAAAVLGKINKP